MVDMPCCKPECEDPATVEIIDQADGSPYTPTLQSCDAHIGDLLTHDPSLPEGVPNEWVVRSLELVAA